MNRLDLLIKIYALLHNYPHVPYWLLTPMRKSVRYVAKKILPQYLMKEHKEGKKEVTDVIVSFTSFPHRINNVWQVVECMKRQTYQPKKIVLWLSKDQFPTALDIPRSLRDREDGTFEIRIVEGDIRSHKKYYYVAQTYPNSLVFLIDDDIYYPTDIIERTMKAYSEYPDSVIANYGYHMCYDKDGRLRPYNSWPKEYRFSVMSDLFFGSGGGTLICPAKLHKELTNIEKAQELAPIADDIWLNAIVKLSNKKIVLLNNGMILPIYNKNDIKLASSNKGTSQNDVQLESVMNYMKTLS